MEWAGDRVQIRSQGSLTMLASLCMLYALQVSQSSRPCSRLRVGVPYMYITTHSTL